MTRRKSKPEPVFSSRVGKVTTEVRIDGSMLCRNESDEDVMLTWPDGNTVRVMPGTQFSGTPRFNSCCLLYPVSREAIDAAMNDPSFDASLKEMFGA